MVRPEWIVVGKVVRAHGLRGEVRVFNESDNPDRFAPGTELYCRAGRRPHAGPRDSAGSERRLLRIEAVRPTTGALLVSFAGIENRTAAESLRGAVLEIPASSLPELDEDEFYPFELQGLRVEDEEGVVRGAVLELLDTPANPVLSLSLADGGTVLVPFTHEAVPVVDVEAGRAVVLRRFLESVG